MRVLLTADVVGGVWNFVHTLSAALADEGHEVLVAVLGEPDPDRHRPPPGVEIVARPYRLEWMDDADADVDASTGWISEIAALWLPDVVHLNQFSPALGAFDAPVVVTAHSDVLSWFSESLGAPAPEEWERYGELVRRALIAADVVVAPSAYQSRLLERHYGRSADRVIHNGASARAEAQASTREPIAICAARAWDSAKGVSVLDRATGLLAEHGRSVHLLGPTSAPGGEHLALQHLQAHGALPRHAVDAWFARAAVYAAPSLYEPFGLAPLEAALHGCALVLSDIGSFRELWDGCAEFVPADDPERLAFAIADLLSRPERASALAAAARRRAGRRYTTAAMVARYLDLYAAARRASPAWQATADRATSGTST